MTKLAVCLNETQAEVGVVARMWTKQDIENAKKRPNGWIKDNYFLNPLLNASGSSDQNG